MRDFEPPDGTTVLRTVPIVNDHLVDIDGARYRYTIGELLNTMIDRNISGKLVVTFDKKDFLKVSAALPSDGPIRFVQPPIGIAVADGEYGCTDMNGHIVDLPVDVANAAIIRCRCAGTDRTSVSLGVVDPRTWSYVYHVQVKR